MLRKQKIGGGGGFSFHLGALIGGRNDRLSGSSRDSFVSAVKPSGSHVVSYGEVSSSRALAAVNCRTLLYVLLKLCSNA